MKCQLNMYFITCGELAMTGSEVSHTSLIMLVICHVDACVQLCGVQLRRCVPKMLESKRVLNVGMCRRPELYVLSFTVGGKQMAARGSEAVYKSFEPMRGAQQVRKV